MKQTIFLLAFVLVIACKRKKELYAIPDNTAQIEANFPYKNLQKPLVFVNEYFSADSIKFVFESKSTSTTKNINYPNNDPNDNLSRLQSYFYNWITLQAPNFVYGLSLESIVNQPRFAHDFQLFNFSANILTNPVEEAPLMVGRNSFYIRPYSDTMTFYGKKYYNVYEVVTGGYYNAPKKSERDIGKVLFCESNGVIGLFDNNIDAWYFLKP